MPAMRGAVHHATRPELAQETRAARLYALTLAVALACAGPARAFGPSGHRVAGHVAERYLCASTRQSLKPLLAAKSLAEAGLWADAIRGDPRWEHSKPWHFINVPDHGSLARAARKDANNVLAALARFERELGDRSLPSEQRAIALRFVVHFVADIHQPLHVGRAEDRGGNLVRVSFEGRETNLHALWDAEFLRLPGGPAPRARAAALTWPAAGERVRWQRAAPVDWAGESRALRGQIYGFGRAGAPTPALTPLTSAYVAGARATIDRRLVQAGVRLAARLNAVLGAGAACPAEVATGHPNL